MCALAVWLINLLYSSTILLVNQFLQMVVEHEYMKLKPIGTCLTLLTTNSLTDIAIIKFLLSTYIYIYRPLSPFAFLSNGNLCFQVYPHITSFLAFQSTWFNLVILLCADFNITF